MMGSNDKGKLGIGDPFVKETNVPCLVEELISFKVTKISCGIYHTVALTDIGHAFAWGDNEFGALGLGSI
jgi:alpha-tubulin suppressor-like RCC1 family protein